MSSGPQPHGDADRVGVDKSLSTSELPVSERVSGWTAEFDGSGWGTPSETPEAVDPAMAGWDPGFDVSDSATGRAGATNSGPSADASGGLADTGHWSVDVDQTGTDWSSVSHPSVSNPGGPPLETWVAGEYRWDVPVESTESTQLVAVPGTATGETDNEPPSSAADDVVEPEVADTVAMQPGPRTRARFLVPSAPPAVEQSARRRTAIAAIAVGSVVAVTAGIAIALAAGTPRIGGEATTAGFPLSISSTPSGSPAESAQPAPPLTAGTPTEASTDTSTSAGTTPDPTPASNSERIAQVPNMGGATTTQPNSQPSTGQIAQTSASNTQPSSAPSPSTVTTTVVPLPPGNPPVISMPSSATTIRGTNFELPLVAAGSGALTWSLESGSLPAGLRLSSGAIVGTPSGDGRSFVLKVAGPDGVTSTHAMSITVGSAPTIATNSAPKVARGNAYQLDLQGSGTGPLGWSAEGPLPPGLALSGARISGTPTTVGNYTFNVKLANEFGEAPQSLTIVVVEPLTITSEGFSYAVLGEAFSAPLTVSGGSGAVAWSIVEGSLPTGLVLSDSKIHGTATAANFFEFKLKAVDDVSETTLDVWIRAIPPAAVLTTELPAGVVGVEYFQKLDANGSADFVWSIEGDLPPGLSLAGDQYVSGTPETAGTYTFNATVVDYYGQEASGTVTLTIAAP
jgi:Putative Ig domain